MRKALVPVLAVGLLLIVATVAYAAFLGGPIGQQPTVTPQMRVTGPTLPFKTGEPVAVAVAYRDFDLQPQLRCNPAGPCTGTLPQTTVDGRAQGHIHVYLQRVVGQFPNVDSDSFCIPATKVLSGPYDGTVSGNCPAVTVKGLYRITAEFQSNSHVSALKAENKPQDVPTSDVTYVIAR